VPSPDRGPLPDDRRQPLTARLRPDHPLLDPILDAHEAAVARDDDGYLDPVTGAFVFTAASHWARGTCCQSGCRHCPYEHGPRVSRGQPRPGTE
jgi:hypothetical protein